MARIKENELHVEEKQDICSKYLHFYTQLKYWVSFQVMHFVLIFI